MLPELVDWFKALAKTSIARFRSQYADPPAAFCRHHFQPQVRRQHQIPIAPVAPPVLNLPRLRALALFGRRPPQRVDRPAFRQPKTSTTGDMHWIYDLTLSTGIQNIKYRAVGVSALRASSDRVRQDSFELHEVGELTTNARQMGARNLMHVGARGTFWPS